MATQTLTIPPCDPDVPTVTLQFDPPVPPPDFIEIEDADGTVHRYIRSNWRPIETALKDEPLILGRHDEVETERWVGEGKWIPTADPDGGFWSILHPFISTQPTHWQPMPAPPGEVDAEA